MDLQILRMVVSLVVFPSFPMVLVQRMVVVVEEDKIPLVVVRNNEDDALVVEEDKIPLVVVQNEYNDEFLMLQDDVMVEERMVVVVRMMVVVVRMVVVLEEEHDNQDVQVF